MINCVLKMLGISLVQGYDTFAVWSILIIPLVVALLFLLVKGIMGVDGYATVGRFHAFGGWLLAGLAVVIYVILALWSDPSRNDFKQFAIRNVKDKTPGVENRRLAMMVDSSKTMGKIPEQLDQEKTKALLRALQIQLDDTDDAEQKMAFNSLLVDYLVTIPSVQGAVQDLAQTGMTLLEATLQSVKGEDVQRLLLEAFQSGDLGSAVKKSFKTWFKTLDLEDRRPVETAAFFSGNANETDSREIAYRSGYGNSALGIIRFFVSAQRWFRGLLWSLVAIAIGMCFVAGGRKIANRAGAFQQGYDNIFRSVFGGVN